VITIAVHDKKEGNMTLVQWTTANKFRLDMNQEAKGDDGPGNGTMIVNREAKTVTIVMHEQKMYMTSPLQPPKTQATEKDGDKEDDHGKLTRTGRTEVVAGITCDVYHGVTTTRGKQEEGDICFAKGVGFMPGIMSGAGRMGQGMGAAYAKIGAPAGAGIMKVTSYVKGKPHVDMEVTKVDKRALSASDFQPPAGYTLFKTPAH